MAVASDLHEVGVAQKGVIMQTTERNSVGTSLGEAIEASCELGSAISPDSTVASELAARHVGRMLAQGGNARLAAALAMLANELGAGTPRVLRSPARRPAMLRAGLSVASR